MVSKELLKKFLKISSDRIIAGLKSNKWSGEEKEAAVTVLKKRGKDVAEFLSDDTILKPASAEKISELSNAINAILSRNKQSEIDKLYELTQGVEDITTLPADTVEYYLTTIKEWSSQQKAEQQAKQKKLGRKISQRLKDIKLSDEHQKTVDSILRKDKLSKKQKILEMFEAGISRSEVLSLCFVDKVYVYDLYRIWVKEKEA